MKRLCFLFLLILGCGLLSAQDFQCMVSVNANQVTGGVNQQRYNDLQQKIYQFINERKWCQYNLKNNERIECSLRINLTEVNGDVFKGTMAIMLQRPVYKASYKTTLLNFQDKNIQFTYAEGDPLEYADGANLNQFTALIAYYLNLFLAVEFDSFSLNGGSPYYSKCQSIVNFNMNAKERDGRWPTTGKATVIGSPRTSPTAHTASSTIFSTNTTDWVWM